MTALRGSALHRRQRVALTTTTRKGTVKSPRMNQTTESPAASAAEPKAQRRRSKDSFLPSIPGAASPCAASPRQRQIRWRKAISPPKRGERRHRACLPHTPSWPTVLWRRNRWLRPRPHKPFPIGGAPADTGSGMAPKEGTARQSARSLQKGCVATTAISQIGICPAPPAWNQRSVPRE